MPAVPSQPDLRYKTYPAYRDSGVEWLGEIPAAWDCAKIVRYAQLRTGGTPDRNNPDYWVDGNINWMASGEVNKRIINEVDSKITEKGMRNSNASMLPVDSVMIALNGQGRTKGMSAILKVPSTCNQSLAAFICDERRLHYAYLFYYLESRYRDIRGLVGEHRDGLSLGLLKEITTYLPLVDQQRAIAAFLDRETGKIDARVAKKERLIELLQEKRTALITRAVTKGLNPDVPMKDSAVEWLGEIPAPWEILPLKRCVLRRAGAIKTGPFGSQLLSSEMQGGDVKVYNQRTVIDRDFSGGENFISQEKFRELSAFAIYPGDVLVTTRGTIGRCAIVPKDAEQGILHPCLMRIQPDPDKLLREYLALLIQDSYLLRTQLGLASNATTIEVIYSNTMSCVLVPRPALSEQAAIVSWINERTAQIDGLIGKVSGGIDRLKEFRSALISAAVTGKIDVRREVAS